MTRRVTKYGIAYLDDFGRLHSENDKPALISSTNNRYWFKHGKAHRENDQPAVILASGTMAWYINGLPGRNSMWVPLFGIYNPHIVYPDGFIVYFYGGTVCKRKGYLLQQDCVVTRMFKIDLN